MLPAAARRVDEQHRRMAEAGDSDGELWGEYGAGASAGGAAAAAAPGAAAPPPPAAAAWSAEGKSREELQRIAAQLG
eukprot:gene10089-11594_t